MYALFTTGGEAMEGFLKWYPGIDIDSYAVICESSLGVYRQSNEVGLVADKRTQERVDHLRILQQRLSCVLLGKSAVCR